MSASARGRWLVVGAAGMLGRDLVDVLDGAGHQVVALDLPEIDITDPASVRAALERGRPDVVVNAAAYTAVDDAESHEDVALRINGVGPGVLARAVARDPGCDRLVHLSTDYVFDGSARTPYPEDAPPAPRSAYGRTKLAGELSVRAGAPDKALVVRTAWLYGVHGRNFVRTMLDLEATWETVDVVDDQVGQPTWTRDLSELIVRLVEAGAPAGTYHGTSAGQTSWFGLAREIFRLAGADPERVRPTASTQFVRPAPRPSFSVLGHSALVRIGIAPIRDWRRALAEAQPLIEQARRG